MKKKRKFRRFVFTGTASLASLDGITISQGTEVKVYEDQVVIHGMKYARVPEIELFIRDRKLVLAKSDEASNAIAQHTNREKDVLRTRSTEPVDVVEEDGTIVKKVRGMTLEDGGQDYTEIPIPPTPSEQEAVRRRSAKASTGRVVTEEMREVAKIGRGLTMEEIAASVGATSTPTGEMKRTASKKKRSKKSSGKKVVKKGGKKKRKS